MILDILIVVGAVLTVVGVTVCAVLRKKRGITGCACCPHRGHCTSCPTKNKQPPNHSKTTRE